LIEDLGIKKYFQFILLKEEKELQILKTAYLSSSTKKQISGQLEIGFKKRLCFLTKQV
jgi:hypothetical protein